MGNCETCEGPAGGEVMVNPLEDKQRNNPFSIHVDDLPEYCNEAVRATYAKLGEFVFTRTFPYEWKNPVKLENGAIYQGQWDQDAKNGQGKQIWPDGSIYEGYWKNNLANGEGRLIHSGGDVYEGDWVDDRAQGKGVYMHQDGASYSGEWHEDKQHGFGEERWTDGATYEGNFVNALK